MRVTCVLSIGHEEQDTKTFINSSLRYPRKSPPHARVGGDTDFSLREASLVMVVSRHRGAVVALPTHRLPQRMAPTPTPGPGSQPQPGVAVAAAFGGLPGRCPGEVSGRPQSLGWDRERVDQVGPRPWSRSCAGARSSGTCSSGCLRRCCGCDSLHHGGALAPMGRRVQGSGDDSLRATPSPAPDAAMGDGSMSPSTGRWTRAATDRPRPSHPPCAAAVAARTGRRQRRVTGRCVPGASRSGATSSTWMPSTVNGSRLDPAGSQWVDELGGVGDPGQGYDARLPGSTAAR